METLIVYMWQWPQTIHVYSSSLANSTREGCTLSIHSSGHKQYTRVATHYGKVVTHCALVLH